MGNFNGSPALLLYLERIEMLGKEKYRNLMKQDQDAVEILY